MFGLDLVFTLLEKSNHLFDSSPSLGPTSLSLLASWEILFLSSRWHEFFTVSVTHETHNARCRYCFSDWRFSPLALYTILALFLPLSISLSFSLTVSHHSLFALISTTEYFVLRTLYPLSVYVNIFPIHTCLTLQCSGLLLPGLFIIIFRRYTMWFYFSLEKERNPTVLDSHVVFNVVNVMNFISFWVVSTCDWLWQLTFGWPLKACWVVRFFLLCFQLLCFEISRFLLESYVWTNIHNSRNVFFWWCRQMRNENLIDVFRK